MLPKTSPFLFWGMQYKGCCAEGYNCTVLYKQALAVAKNAVHYECAGNALVIAYGICEFTIVAAFHVYYAMTAVHTGIACLNGVGDYCALIIAAEHVVAFAKRNYLLVTESVLNYNNMPEILGLNIFIAFANAYCKTLAAMLALENQSLSLLVTTCVEINLVITLGANNLAHNVLS